MMLHLRDTATAHPLTVSMPQYIAKRLLLMIPTLFGILLLNFVIVQAAPGGPVEQMIMRLTDPTASALDRIGGSTGADTASLNSASLSADQRSRGARGLDPELVKEIERMYGFDKPAHERFFLMVKNYLSFNFGESYFRSVPVTQLILEKIPVSISLGLWTTLLIYLISIPLGIAKAMRDSSKFDVATSIAITIAYAIPSFLFAILLIILFAGGSYVQWFPLRGLTSDNWQTLSWPLRIADYFWHIALPTLALVLSGFASLTLLTKNSFIDEIGKQYVITARAKGLSEREVLWRHVFRNAMLIVVAGFPQALLRIFFTGALLIEVIFSLDGLGLLGFEAAISRDYPVMFGTLFIFTLFGLVLNLIGDLTYTLVDPRIDFAKRA